jgi:chitinase
LATVVNNNCSGVEQESGQFAKVLSAGSTTISNTNAPDLATAVAPSDHRGPSSVTAETATSPNSPYPQWRRRREYDTGAHVVWGNVVYEAKWGTRGDDPKADPDNVWETPWELIDSSSVVVIAPATTVPGRK